MPVGVSAYVPLATMTLTAAQTFVTFTSISQAYRDLRLVISGKSTSGPVSALVTFNGIAAAGGYTTAVVADANGSATPASTGGNNSYGYLGYFYGRVTTDGWICTTDFLDYSQTNKYKNYLARYSSGSDGTGMISSRITVLGYSAITSFSMRPNGTTWAAGSTFTLYGVEA